MKKWLAAAIILGFSLFHLSVITRHSLDSDEIFSVNWAQWCSYGEFLFPPKCFDDGNPPLHFLLLKTWFTVFGVSDFSARFLSLILGTLSLGWVYHIAQRHFRLPTELTLILLLFLASSSLFSFFTLYARAYIVVIFACLATFNFGLTLIDQKKISFKEWMLGVIGVTLGLYSHYTFAVFLAFFAISFSVVMYFQRDVLKKFMIWLAIASALFAPWALYFLASQLFPQKFIGNSYDYWQLGTTWPGWRGWTQIMTNSLLTFEGTLASKFLAILLVGLFLLACLGLFIKSRNKKEKVLSFLVLISITIYSLTPLHKIFSLPKYFVFIIPFVFLFVFVLFKQKYKNNFAVVLLLLGIWLAFTLRRESAFRIEDWRGASQLIQTEPAESIIITDAEYLIPVLKYYYSGNFEVGCLDELDAGDQCHISTESLSSYQRIYYLRAEWNPEYDGFFESLDRQLVEENHLSSIDVLIFE